MIPNRKRIGPKDRIIRKPKSPSFKESGIGEYTIIKDGKKTNIRAEAIGQGNITINFFDEAKRIGVFTAEKSNLGWWNLFHRAVHSAYQGYYMGRTGFRLVEQQVKKAGGKGIYIDTNQKDVIRTLLKIGYGIKTAHRNELCRILGIPIGAPTKTIILALEGQWMEKPHPLTLYKKL